MKNLTLSRPLVVLDLETTSADPATARIVDAAFWKYHLDGCVSTRNRRLNPGTPIPAEATAIHGIADADIADCPQFGTVAKSLLEFLDGADLIGFALKRFDLPVLAYEFDRAGLAFDLTGRHVIDVCQIFHEREPRTLEAAVAFYCGQAHDSAHSAAGDVGATAAVLDGMFARYPDLPRSVESLAAAFHDPDQADLAGFFRRADSGHVFAKGKHRDRPAREHRDYLRWMLGASFLPDTKRIARAELESSTLKE